MGTGLKHISVQYTLSKITNIAEIILSYNNFFSKFYYNFYKYHIKAEISFTEVDYRSKVLCIGGGEIPHTAIRFALESGASVDVIDNRPNAIPKARRCVNAFGASDRVNVYNGNGLKYPIQNFDVVIVANHVHPKNDVLTRLYKDSETTTRIIYRNSDFYSSIDCNFNSFLIPCDCPYFYRYKLYFFRSYFINKNRSLFK